MADMRQLPSPQNTEPDDDLARIGADDSGFYQILVLFVVFAILIGVIVVGANGGV
ncbi:MAG: hypothetical protein SGJ24_17415 [Chloroflexota bacterium]|nr:hypothetical protein [Chloroflexota bacterium]